MKELLHLQDVRFSYSDGTPALENINTTLYSSQRVAILGNNGAGKSTFFLCCNGVLTPSDGKITLHGKPTDSRNGRSRLRQAVGLVFQDPDVQILGATVQAEISFGPMNLNLSVEEVRQRVDTVIREFELETFRNRAPHSLSGGEKKRVSLADILAMEPELLLLDEPASGLDPKNCRLLEQHLAHLHRNGMGIVIATHDVDFAWRWAQRILIFSKGTLQADGTPEEVFSMETLLADCGLVQPMLRLVGQRLGQNPLPKSVEELPNLQ